ncbi:hypothetical protein MNBD_CHLOROFLEXI01-4212 [hydrothermal vent metagenome]|uniref:Uncharacterized protein n=1 Tax=hydrothermal vent metagenome TaxID=652676 RepID=A0A3B0UL34_9ZZZZ
MRLKRKQTVFILFTLLIIFVVVPAVLAHPLGNFTINRYAHLNLQEESVAVFHIVDIAEIPTFQERQKMDTNGDGTVDEAEQAVYLAAQAVVLVENLSLTVNDTTMPITAESWSLAFPPGQGDLPTMRLELMATAVPPQSDVVWQLNYVDNNFPERVGWQETVVTAVDGLTILESNVSQEDVSNQLRNYPEDLLRAPMAVNQAVVQFAPVANGLANQSSVVETAVVVNNTNQLSQNNAANLLTTALDSSWATVTLLIVFGLGMGYVLFLQKSRHKERAK